MIMKLKLTIDGSDFDYTEIVRGVIGHYDFKITHAKSSTYQEALFPRLFTDIKIWVKINK